MVISSSPTRRVHWREEVPPWQRFSLRLMAWYGGAVLLIVSALSLWSYHLLMDAEMSALQHRLLTLSQALATTVDGDEVFGRGNGPEAESYWTDVAADFRRVGRAVPDAGEVYLLRVTDRPGHFVHVVDVRFGEETVDARFLEPYDGSAFPVLLAGMRAPSVEERLWAERRVGPDGRVEVLHSISGYAPVRDGAGETVAVVGVDVFAPRVAALRRAALGSAGAAFVVALALLALVTTILGRQILRPLGEMIDATDAIAHGQHSVRLRTARADEFGVLGRHFDEMADGLADRDFIRDTFGRYVSPQVAAAVLADKGAALGGELREVTVLFTDLRGYSTLTEEAEPAQVVRLLNDYFGAMNAIIDAHDGVVIEFLGDGILAAFGAPVRVEDHARRAVDAALAMRARLDALNAEWEEDGRAALWKDAGVDRLVMRIGIHTGRVIAGNLGSRERTKYAVIGDNVNVAARLEQLNKDLGTTILISGAVRARLDDDIQVRPRGTAKVKGRVEPVEVFAL